MTERLLGGGMADEDDGFASDRGKLEPEPADLTLRALRGIVPALAGRIMTGFEDQIEEAREEEADRIAGDTRPR